LPRAADAGEHRRLALRRRHLEGVALEAGRIAHAQRALGEQATICASSASIRWRRAPSVAPAAGSSDRGSAAPVRHRRGVLRQRAWRGLEVAGRKAIGDRSNRPPVGRRPVRQRR
jgi:hypothetical protein